MFHVEQEKRWAKHVRQAVEIPAVLTTADTAIMAKNAQLADTVVH